MHQEHYPGQRDSPTPMRVLTPPISLLPQTATTSSTTNNNNITRTNPRRRCYKCHQTSHTKCFCPRYRCQNCRRLQPGHLTNNCPNQPMTNDHEYNFGHDYDPNGNLNGEQ